MSVPMAVETLVACSHGTDSREGRRAIAALLDQVRAALPGVPVEEAFVDVQEPAVGQVLAGCLARPDDRAVVVPVLLSTGFHTEVDIAGAVAARPGRAVAAPALGPHEALAEVLRSRLAEAGAEPAPGIAIVLAAAGSTDPRAEGDVAAVARLLAERVDGPVQVGFAAGSGPRIVDVVASARREGAARVVVASYVLAPGYFADVIAGCGADVVTAPLAPDERLAAIIVQRYREAVWRPQPAGR